jgi:predicted ribosome quality control (RQC) complex YloA/Tae2 family protein
VQQLNAFLLERLVGELRPQLVGGTFAGAHTQRKGELVLRFKTVEDEVISLRVGFGAQASYCVPVGPLKQKRQGTRAFFEGQAGQRVLGLRQVAGERIWVIELHGGAHLILLLQGARGNVLLLEGKRVAECFRKRTEGTFNLPADVLLPTAAAEWAERLAQHGGDRRRALPAFDKLLWAKVDELATDEPGGDWPALEAVLHQLRTGAISVDADTRPPTLLLAADSGYPSARSALGAWWAALQHQLSVLGQREAWQARLAEQQAQLTRQRDSLARTLESLMAQRSPAELANLILAQLHRFSANDTRVQLDDFYLGGTVSIHLENGVNPQTHAEQLYAQQRADDARRAALPAEIAFLTAQLTELDTAQTQLTTATDRDAAKAWLQRWSALLKQAPLPQADIDRLPYRRFRVEGYEVRVGRSAADNDALTLRHSRPSDLWLHARAVAGSHVLVVNPKSAEVPEPVIERAAGLAAWFSKQKGESLAAVSVTERKYVRKGRRMAPGQVRLERERVLMVAPLDPATLG